MLNVLSALAIVVALVARTGLYAGMLDTGAVLWYTYLREAIRKGARDMNKTVKLEGKPETAIVVEVVTGRKTIIVVGA